MKITRRATFRNKKTGETKLFYPGSEVGANWELVVLPEDRLVYISRMCSGVYEARKELVECRVGKQRVERILRS